MSRFARATAILLIALTAACAAPPDKEMNQAQGAIDAARAAGADKFAAAEFTAAVQALRRSEEAVAARDYRLALNHAIDSRERAQNAAKLAVEARSRSRGDAERTIAELAALVDRAESLLRDPRISRARAAQAGRTAIDAAQKSLQEARAAVGNDDYAGALKAVDGLAAKIRALINELDEPAAPPARRGQR
jgi:hypothetical protein